MYYRDKNLNLYKIISEYANVYICEALKGPHAGNIVTINKSTGSISNENTQPNGA